MATYSAGSASIAIRPDLRDFRRRVKAALKGIDETYDVKVTPDLDGFQAKLDRQLDTLRSSFDVQVGADTAGAAAKLEQLQRDRDIDMSVDVDTAQASAQLAGLQAQTDGISTSLAVIGLKASAIGSIGALASGAIAPTLSLAGGLVSMSGALLAMPAAAGAAGAGLTALLVGFSGMGDALGAVGEDAEKFEDSLEGLSPKATEFVRSIRGMSGEWSAMQDTVQDSLFADLGDDLETFTDRQLPVLEKGLSGLNEELNTGIRSSLAQFSTEIAANDFATFLDNSTEAAAGLADTAAPLSQIWMDIATVGSEYLPGMTDSLGSATQRWSEMISEARRTGELNEIIDSGLDSLNSFVDGVQDAGGIIAGVYRAADEVGAPMISTLGTALDLTNQWVNSVEGQNELVNFFESTSTALSDITPALGIVAGSLVGTIIPAMAGFVSGAAPGFTAFVSGLADGLDAVAPVLPDVGEALGNVLEVAAPLGPVLGTTAQGFSAVVGVVGDVATVLTPITEFLGEHPALVTAAIAAWAGFKVVPGLVDRVSSSVGKVRDITQPAGQNVRFFGQSLREAYDYAGQANPELGRVGKTMEVVGGQGGVASAAMNGLKGAAGGLVSFFGGPWGVALMGATVAISAVTDANSKARDAQDSMAQAAQDAAAAQSELKSAAAGTTGALSEDGLAAAARVANGELAELVEMGEAYSGWLYSVDTDTNVWERMFNVGDEWEQDKAAAREIKEEYEALKGATEELGLPMEELNRIVAEGGPEYEALVAHLREAGGSADGAADQLEGARAQIDQMVSDARRLDPAVADAAAAIDVLADSSSSADEKLGALQRMLQAMGLAPKDAEQAMWDAAEATDQLVASLEGVERPASGMGDALFDANGSLDKNNEHARELRESLLDLGTELQNVGSQGGDVQGAFADMQPALQGLADSFGLPLEKVMELGRGLGLVPTEIEVAMALEGADEASQQLAEVWTQIDKIPPGKSLEFSALTEDAETALESIGFKVEDIPNSENVAITATSDQAQATLDAVFQQMADLDGVQVSPVVLLNTTPLEGSAGHAQEILDTLNIQEPTPQAKIIIDQLLSGVDISQGQLDFLASQTPTPLADLNKALLESGVSVSHEMLNALQTRPTTPTLDANGQPLFSAVDASKGKLNELQDRTVTITTVHHRIDYWTQQGYSPEEAATIQGPVPVAQTGGRLEDGRFSRLPAFAGGGRNRGYRLPLSGPGTEQVDGFLGVNDEGMPVARINTGEWVINDRSSEEYDRELAAINAGVFPKLPGYVDGGRVGVGAADLLAFARGESVRGQQASRPLEGAPYVWSGINWGDCSAAMAALARFAAGLDAFAGRFATMNQRQALRSLGFRDGLGGPGDFSIGWYNGGPYGGHTSGTIAGTNVEMGGGRGNGQIGGNAAPASHSQYTDHAHMPLGIPMRSEQTTVYGADSATAPLGAGAVWRGTDITSPTGYTGTASGSGARGRSNAPTSFSEVAGIGAAAAAEGYVKDALDVFGIPDSPPILDAYGQLVDAQNARADELNQLAVENRTIHRVDEEAIADLEKDLANAREDLKIDQLKLGEMDAGTKASTRASAELAVTKQQQKIDELEAKIAEERLGATYKVNEDGTLGSRTKETVAPSLEDPQTAAQVNLAGMYAGMMDAVVGRVPTNHIPKAVRDPLKTAAWDLGVPLRLAHGGDVVGPGGPTDDMVAAWLSNREHVTRAAVADQARPLLHRMNADPLFAGRLNEAVMSASSKSERPTQAGPTYQINVQSVDEGIRKAEMMERRRVAAMGF